MKQKVYICRTQKDQIQCQIMLISKGYCWNDGSVVKLNYTRDDRTILYYCHENYHLTYSIAFNHNISIEKYKKFFTDKDFIFFSSIGLMETE